MYVLINCSTFPNNVSPTGGPLDQLYIAISRDGGASFHTTLVSDISNGGTNPGTWGHVFNQLAIDAAGNLYVGASGNLKGTDPVQTFLIRSLDNGTTWQPPINLNADTPAYASVFPAIATGQSGQVAVGYYRVVNCRTSVNANCKTSDYRNDGVTFQYFIWQTPNALLVNPEFAVTQVTSSVPHYNGICTDGLFCGTPLSSGGNRNLADFESMTVDPTGNIELIIPADPLNVLPTDSHPTVNWYFKETSGPLMPPGATNGNGTGNQTYVAASLALPEVRWAALLLVPGGLAAAVFISRRRRRGALLA
ncbi:MAG: exo-alpha-sialidase [Candidatus Dormibacteraeota bacterium]|uniref:Exo-alpha-sialidase n=1 Tax=Candidatus Aeolococcus gillhamiae TaxID=3127015 RepID=A0A934JX47_9BACT|nr:exo-alpha-sialidase [Candidatus Dormibacteraeota bacterium]